MAVEVVLSTGRLLDDNPVFGRQHVEDDRSVCRVYWLLPKFLAGIGIKRDEELVLPKVRTMEATGRLLENLGVS